LIKSTSPLPWKRPLKNHFWRATLPYTLSGSASLLSLLWRSVAVLYAPFGGALTRFSKFWVIEENQGKSPSSWSQLDSNLRSRIHLREDPQLMEKDPQPIPRISKVVGSLQAYIRRPSHGEKEIEKLRST
jgi:hypothetical protein